MRGILLMIGATICFSVMHALIRYLSGELHPFEIAFFRNLFGGLVLLPWFVRHGLAPLKTERFGLHGLRAGINVFAMLTFFYALSITPLAEVAALSFTGPIFATILAIVFLGEVVRMRRWVAILLGFAGTLVVIRPGFESVGPGALMVVASAAIWSCALIVIKVLLRTESSVTVTAYTVVLLAPLSLIAAVFVWQWPSLGQVLYLCAIGVIGTIGQLLMTEALKGADTNVVMPVDFLKMIWAVTLGWFFFAEAPGLFTWIGAAMIFASTSYIAYRENKLRKSAAAPPGASGPGPDSAAGHDTHSRSESV
ncbi:MAG: DMT family transporter [Alphaproteobacteria bacterium]|jgi:drug/metabolite transporter (DMT)-like permease|nr:DMT family transporter [Alphaproteobacteria bacterium]MDP6516763.1 DMT family transporter [Alphaproteobacteria bacterium]